MTLLEKIKEQALLARKARDEIKSAFLTTLYSECANIGKTKRNDTSTEEEVIQILKKFKNNSEEIITRFKNDATEKAIKFKADSLQELNWLEQFLPKQLSTEELTQVISQYLAKIDNFDTKSIGIIMGNLKKEYAGLFDGKKVMEIIKNLTEKGEK